MEFKLYKASGYEESIMALRMSKGSYFSWEKALKIQHLADVVTDHRGFLANPETYHHNLQSMISVKQDDDVNHDGNAGEISGDYQTDVQEFLRLIALTMNNAMGKQKHHTLMKYIDISFFTIGLHRGGQDDLDAHAIAFNNRITRYSTRLADIDDVTMSEWYKDKVIPLHDAVDIADKRTNGGVKLPGEIEIGDRIFKYTPFGYIVEPYADANNGVAKDVKRGGMPLGMESHGIWKIDLWNLRNIYRLRSKLTRANPELKEGMEQLADQIEKSIPMYGPYFRKEYTSTGEWEHITSVRTVTTDEYKAIQKMKKQGDLEGVETE